MSDAEASSFNTNLSPTHRLCALDEENLNCCVSDEMGLGKTIQCISFIAHLFDTRRRGPHLIVVPGSTLDNWLREFEKWLPDLTVGKYHRSDHCKQLYVASSHFLTRALQSNTTGVKRIASACAATSASGVSLNLLPGPCVNGINAVPFVIQV